MNYLQCMNAKPPNTTAAKTQRKAPYGTEAWMRALAEMKVMSLSGIINQLNVLTASEESSVSELADVIMRDPGLTGKVLRVANSALYNPAGQPINTISRAIMLMGFNSIRAISISAMVMEVLLEKHPRDGILDRMAMSFHAAVQARNLTGMRRADVREEVFVAALLLHLGQLLVWSYDHPVADEAYALFVKRAPARATERLLGTTYSNLTREIANQWQLGETLNQVLSKDTVALDRQGAAVVLGEQIARTLQRTQDPAVIADLERKAAGLLKISHKEAGLLLQTSLHEAVDMSAEYNDPRVTRLLETTRDQVERRDSEQPAEEPSIKPLKPDMELQLNCLGQIMQQMGQGLEAGKMFDLALTGLHRGVGLERVALLLLSRDRHQLLQRSVRGHALTAASSGLIFSLQNLEQGALAAILAQKEPVLISAGEPAQLHQGLPEPFYSAGKQSGCLLGPLFTRKREIGLIYADSQLPGADREHSREIGKGELDSFSLFIRQVNACLELLASR